MDPPQTPIVGKLPRRRNGKDPACEPCRKGKMRCDHTTPICMNCRRRRLVDKCVYLPAPQTRPDSRRPAPGSLLSPSQSLASFSFEDTPATDPADEPASRESSPELDVEDGSLFKPSSGFYGPTSFSAVFLDNEEEIDSNVTSPATEETQPHNPFDDIQHEEQSARMALAIKVLDQIPDQGTWKYIFDVYANAARFGMDKGFHRPTILHCAASLWMTFGSTLRQPRNARNLKEMAQLLSRNTRSVFRDTGDGASWLASLSGRKLRWEMLGIMLCTFGNTMLLAKDDDPFWAAQSGRRKQRVSFALEMKQCADGCIQLSNQMDNINFLMVSLLYKRSILESHCTGDTSLLLWRQHGDLVASTTGLGLHRAQDSSEVVTIFSEMRKRTWTAVFCIDKTLSTFTGRPPALSHRYNSCPLPLDLEDDVLLAGKDELARAVSRLDANGWNTNGGGFSAATNLRTTMIYSILLDQILEISLGSDSQYSDERLMHLKHRNEEIPTSLPAWLHLTKESVTPHALQWTRLALRFRYLHCSLLLEQLSTRRGHANQQHLLDVSREMLELTVYMWTERDRFRDRHSAYDWMIMCYGIPSASVICVELLKQMKPTFPPTTHLHLPRSEVIQNLSMLVGFLDWVRPSAANRELCGRMRNIIKSILDKVLDGPPALERQSAQISEQGTGQMGMFELSHIEMGEVDDLTWLDSIDWTRGPFVDLGSDFVMDGFSGTHY